MLQIVYSETHLTLCTSIAVAGQDSRLWLLFPVKLSID